MSMIPVLPPSLPPDMDLGSLREMCLSHAPHHMHVHCLPTTSVDSHFRMMSSLLSSPTVTMTVALTPNDPGYWLT